MGIKVKKIRIKNYRSLKSINIDLTDNCVLIGTNNVGKTSFLQALQLAFAGSRRVSHEDIFITEGEILPKDRTALIDVLIVPTDENDHECGEFDDVWFEHFGELRSEDPVNLNQFVAIRTTISLDIVKGEYEIDRRGLINWPNNEEMENYNEYKKSRITEKLLQAIPVFYMDAKRDIASEMRERTSYWGRMVTDVGLNLEEITKIEDVLDSINNEIISRSIVLKHLVKNLNEIAATVDTDTNSIKINPVSRKIRDLNRGIDITFKDKDSESFPISTHGMGTRSWATFLTLVAYITWKVEQMKMEGIPYHPFVLLEEPESHLHPQAQRQIYKQMHKMMGQKIITSHSPLIVGQAEISDIRHIYKDSGHSSINIFDMEGLEKEDLRKIKQEVFKTRGDLLFAKAFILCEGETEEQALPVFFREYFNCEAFDAGINIVSVGGKGKYKPFLRIAKNFNIKFYLLSDGEKDTIKKVKKDLKEVFGDDATESSFSNVKYLKNEYDFEEYLLNEGYHEELNIAMKSLLGDNYLEYYISKKDNTNYTRVKTNNKCERCNQHIFEDLLRNYKGEAGARKALLDCISENKTAYSSIIADVIIDSRTEDKVPSIIRELFDEINKDLKIKK